MEDDWGLQAVVRGCSSSSSSASSTTNTTTSSCSMDGLSSLSSFQPVNDNLCLPDLFEQTSGSFIQELHDLYKPFFPRSQQTIPICPLSVLGTLHNQSQQQQQHQHQHQHQHQKQQQFLLAPQNHIQAKPSFGGTRNIMPGASTTNTAAPRSKRRKNQMKKVCQVPAEDLSSDMWSWRKYGQKPIKGSPYPRGYYRCSTSKGCLARKQVERNRSDPALFIVTYTAEHNHPMPTHRNSLAGSTRQKHFTSQTSTSGDAKKPTSSPPISPATSLLRATDKVDSREEREDMLEVEDEDDELMGVSDMGVSDDFFEGLEELAGPTSGDCFSEQFTVGLTFPWIGNSATTTAADGG